MSQCKSITNSGMQCTRNALPRSRYCWQHNTPFLISLFVAVGVLVTLIGLWADLFSLGFLAPNHTSKGPNDQVNIVVFAPVNQIFIVRDVNGKTLISVSMQEGSTQTFYLPYGRYVFVVSDEFCHSNPDTGCSGGFGIGQPVDLSDQSNYIDATGTVYVRVLFELVDGRSTASLAFTNADGTPLPESTTTPPPN